MTPQQQAEDLARQFPPGTPCRYWTMTRDFPAKEGEIRFWGVICGTVCAWVTTHPAGVAATHIDCEGVPCG